jgi:4-hydroxybenzoate polyprenyltransferase
MVEPKRRTHVGLLALVTATALCYLVGYPLAIVGHSSAGWVLVALGGPLLIALGITVIKRVHDASERTRQPPIATTYPHAE